MAATVLSVEGSGVWRSLDASLRSLDFDPERAWLIEAWLAGMTVAFLGSLVTARPWFSSVSAVVFVGLTYVFPLGARLTQQVPALFGIKEHLQAGALQHNLLIVLAVTFLAAVPAAATGDLLGREVRQLLRHAGPRLRVAKSMALLGAIAGSFLLASSVDPLLRYGPDSGVFTPGPLPVRTVSVSRAATTPPEVVLTSGQVLSLTYHSDAMGEDRGFNIYLPPTYGLKSASRHRYPVLYLLHGDPGRPADWVHIGAPALFDAGVAHAALPETIVVMPDGNGPVTAATQWANRRAGGHRIEDALLELVTQVDGDYRTLRDRQNRAIGGLSSGAFGAANIAARHPEVFGVAMSFSGYFEAKGPVFGGDPAYIRANSPYDLVRDRVPARAVHYVLVAGAGDPIYLRDTQRFADELSRLGVKHDLLIVPGSHGWVHIRPGWRLGWTSWATTWPPPGACIRPRDRRADSPISAGLGPSGASWISPDTWRSIWSPTAARWPWGSGSTPCAPPTGRSGCPVSRGPSYSRTRRGLTSGNPARARQPGHSR